MRRRQPAWRALWGGAAAGLAVFWWVDDDPARLWRQAWELGLVGVVGFMGWWLYANRDALARAAQAEAAAHGAGPSVGDTRTASSAMDGAGSNRVWHDAEFAELLLALAAAWRSPVCWGRVRRTGGARTLTSAGTMGPSTGGKPGAEDSGVMPTPATGSAPETNDRAPQPIRPLGPPGPINPLDGLVCPACGNISVMERDGWLVCQHCGYTRGRRDP